MKCDEDMRQGIETIKGEVLRIEGNRFVVERFDGKQVHLHIDATTKMGSLIGRGDHIEARVNDQSHVLLIDPVQQDRKLPLRYRQIA